MNNQIVLPTTALVLTGFGILVPSLQEIHHSAPNTSQAEDLHMAEELVSVVILSLVIMYCVTAHDWAAIGIALVTLGVLAGAYEYALVRKPIYA